MRKFVKRVVITMLIACLAAMMFIFPVACSNEEGDSSNTEENKDTNNNKPEDTKPVDGGKAIIILPGIMGSNIIDDASGMPLWAPIDASAGIELKTMGVSDYASLLNQQGIMDLLDFDKKPGGAYDWLEKMKVVINPDGTATSPNKDSAQVIDDNGKVKYPHASTYGTLEYYKKTFNYLEENFGKDYDVRMFEYDWRLNNMDSAIALENFINDHNYSSVILVAHSMGGVLASTYLARSEANQKKVDKFISLGTPFFGSHKAIRMISSISPEGIVKMLGDDPAMNSLLEGAKGMINKNNGEGAFEEFVSRMNDFVVGLPTIYQLMPYVDMMNAYGNDAYPELKDINIMTKNGKPIKTYDEFRAFLKEQGFNDIAIDNMIKWQDEQYVTKDGKKVHSSMTVDTYYFVGNDVEGGTELCANFKLDRNTKKYVFDNCTMSQLGDGTVPAYSASCGLPMDDPRIIECKGVSHGDLNDEDGCLENMKKVISGQWNK